MIMKQATAQKTNLISVIIPTYNCKNYIIQAISSVLDQTYKKVEIIVVDDGSTDGTYGVLKPLLGRIKYVSQQNGGVSKARNVGMGLAQGEFIAFLDADDFWLPSKLELQWRFLKKFSHVAAIFSDFALSNSNGEIIEPRGIKKSYPVFNTYKVKIDDIFSSTDNSYTNTSSARQGKRMDIYYGNIFKFLFLGNFIKTSSIVVRKQASEQIGKFNPNLKTQEDYEYFLRLSMRFDLSYIDSPLVITRKRADQLTRDDQKESTVSKSLEVIENISSEAKQIVGKEIVKRRLAEKYRTLGLVYLGKRKKRQARDAIKVSLQHNRLDMFSFFIYFWSFLPFRFAEFLRKTGRKVFS